MTQDEQQQVNAMMRFYEQQVANLASSGAQMANLAEAFAIQLKAARAELEKLKKRKKPEIPA